ncbi:glycoside hydrolase family 1 protein [Collybiopsis luxurians FD-317 M1]|uniref:Glycoside hydrolase family 1 protein n=1 Tax=Collybiopsis luxurians FD-317 M1 TaxID=944289 RepID=A0A0D0B2K9_9AGAR|nr:glycoside hydrolase family 1 protein [Collybiopsis luxurians FD-317 M1]
MLLLPWVSAALLYGLNGVHATPQQVTSSVTRNSTTISGVSVPSSSVPSSSVPSSTSTLITTTSTVASSSSSVAASTITPAPSSSTTNEGSLPTIGATASFPPVGSFPRDYSPAGLQKLWNIVGPVESPPFTTTVIPTPVVLPSPPPALYPSSYAPAPKDILPNLKFPKGFIFGVDTAAYQVEGATKEEGKGPSNWDWASRQPGVIADNSTADVVDLHYYLYKQDIARIAALGVNSHSFSISWARIFPFGTADSPVNQEGLDHYADVIQSHLKANIAPVVTLFHWDTPLALEAYYGGFTSPNITDDFIHYAKTVFAAYNGSVHTWYTFNEPRVFCSQVGSYPFNLTYAPGVNISTAPYQCSYNLLKAHAGAVKAFREMKITGEIAFKSDDYIGIPWRANNTDDAAAVERHAAFQIGVFADPVFTTGDWPQILKDTLSPEYLPRLTKEEQKDILGTADFFAIDSYRTYYVRAPDDGLAACVNNSAHPNWPTCNIETQYSYDPLNLYGGNVGWAVGPPADPLSDWLQATPQLLRASFKEYHKRWPAKKIYLSEFGFAEPFEGVRQPSLIYHITEDVDRTNYYMTYLAELLLSIHEDGIPVQGAFAWAMVDNAEWNSGQSARFGIQYVNYSTPTLERVYKRSAFALSEFFKAHLQN